MSVNMPNRMETYYGLVRTPADAIKLFEACRVGILPRVQRRLSEKERQAIRPGSVFVWDEREAGMRRWTDGKSWSASRVSGSFLTYREMEGKRSSGFGAPLSAPRRNAGRTPDSGRGSDEDQDNNEPEGYRYKPDGLMKQSFSITAQNGQHLHLISYYTRPGSHNLMMPTTDPSLRQIVPPKGMYPDTTWCESGSPAVMNKAPIAVQSYMQHLHGGHVPHGRQMPPHMSPYQSQPPQYPPQHPYGAYPPSPVATPPYNSVPYSAAPPPYYSAPPHAPHMVPPPHHGGPPPSSSRPHMHAQPPMNGHHMPPQSQYPTSPQYSSHPPPSTPVSATSQHGSSLYPQGPPPVPTNMSPFKSNGELVRTSSHEYSPHMSQAQPQHHSQNPHHEPAPIDPRMHNAPARNPHGPLPPITTVANGKPPLSAPMLIVSPVSGNAVPVGANSAGGAPPSISGSPSYRSLSHSPPRSASSDNKSNLTALLHHEDSPVQQHQHQTTLPSIKTSGIGPASGAEQDARAIGLLNKKFRV
ncbi:Gluconate transport-inducing protein [Ceratocystis pirilliformis]|uniref:Gluconate transport-inducing protein n=1 Tax=Ceratocystis pirilliformis TaxID=259994 RepID=A0ABR3Z9M7_9PEZI